MKRIAQILLALVAITSFASLASADNYTPRIDRRQANQHERIHDGVRGGQLTRREARQLRTGQRHIRRSECRMKSDGRMTYRERSRMHRMQNHESRRIYRFKHNGRQA